MRGSVNPLSFDLCGIFLLFIIIYLLSLLDNLPVVGIYFLASSHFVPLYLPFFSLPLLSLLAVCLSVDTFMILIFKHMVL